MEMLNMNPAVQFKSNAIYKQESKRQSYPCVLRKHTEGVDIWLRSFITSGLHRNEWTLPFNHLIHEKINPASHWMGSLGKPHGRSRRFGEETN